MLISCFTDFSGYPAGTTTAWALWRPKVWCAATPELWQFYQDNNIAPGDMSLRTKQLLGLPANHAAYFVMEFYVNSTSLFRAMDPSITNPVTATTFPSYMKPGNYYYDWFIRNFSTYEPSISHGVEVPPYPWLRTGYTYDWGSNDPQHVGLTEFIADSRISTPTPLTQRKSTAQPNLGPLGNQPHFVQVLRAGVGFVRRDRRACDTLWMGSQYLPVTPGATGNIHPGVTVSGGEGITVSDLDGQPSNVVITNAGAIQGPSKDHFNNPHPSSVWFTNTGGTLDNSGTITGDDVGVLGSDTCTRPIIINNCGTIRGNSLAIHTGGGDDVINTNGLIFGGINSGPGNDTICVTGGAISGSIDGGTGTNTLNFSLPHDVTFTLDNDILQHGRGQRPGRHGAAERTRVAPVTVSPGATLGGVCVIDGNLVNRGTVAPGNSIGAMTVGGNYATRKALATGTWPKWLNPPPRSC